MNIFQVARAQTITDYTSLERTISKRKGKMYLDFLQNRPDATIAGIDLAGKIQKAIGFWIVKKPILIASVT